MEQAIGGDDLGIGESMGPTVKIGHPLARYEQRDPGLAASFTNRYEIWIAVHSLLYYRDQEETAAQHAAADEANDDAAEERERQERSHMATLAALFAAREVEIAATSPNDESQDA